MEYCKNFLYNFVVGSYTTKLYADFFNRIEENSKILDIGVGNGHSLCDNRDMIIGKKLKILAIDIDRNAIGICSKKIIEKGLEDYINVRVVDFFNINEKFDYIYFSNSYSVIPCSVKFIEHAFSLLEDKEESAIYISTTLFENKDFIMENVKFYFKKIALGIDFGRCITHDEFDNEILCVKGKILDKKRVIKRWVPYFGKIEIFTMKIIKLHF